MLNVDMRMAANAQTAHRIRTSLVVGAAVGTLIAAALMSPRSAAYRLPDGTVSSTDGTNGISLSARLATRRIVSGDQLQNVAVTITTGPAVASSGRPPVSLAIVIDRSGSMTGAPIENARAAALAMIRQLDPGDAFAVVSYSSSATTVLPMQPANDAARRASQAVLETIDASGGTCISCGLEAGAVELAHSPVIGLRRLLLISDGQANAGVYDRDELAGLAARTAARGMSISTVGVGLDFDEATLRRLAEVGRGNYSFVEDTVALAAMFVRELATLGNTVASDVQLRVTARPGIHIEEAYGYPMTRLGNGVVVPVADLRAGESHKIVLRIGVAPDHTGELGLADLALDWRGVGDGAAGVAHAVASVDVVDDPAAVAASVDPAAMRAIEQALSARAIEDAAAAYDRGGLPAARQVLDQRAQAVRANAGYLGPSAVDQLEAVRARALDGFARAPAAAKKQASVTAHELAR
jgi:Ca-activated chloride channel family protein